MYEAYDPELGRRVALKLLRPDVRLGSVDERRTRMLREAQQHARLSHPNVVGIHDVGTFRDQVFLAMEFMDRGTLGAWLAVPRPRAEVLARFLEAGRGLAAAHAAGLVHRDFKPDNVLLDERGVARVSDFGLAHAASGELAVGGGTAAYMSPEQRAGRPVTPASDQFSFCVALLRALTGQLPFGSAADATPGPQFPPGAPLSPWLRRVLTRGLAAAPGERYPSMDALLADLAHDPDATRRRRLTVVALGLLVAALVATTGVLLARETPAERAQRECEAAVAADVEALWSPARVTRMREGFVRAAGEPGGETFGRLQALLEPELRAFAATRREACARPLPRAQRQCVDARGRVLRSLVELFTDAQPEVVEAALTTARLEVLPVSACRLATAEAPLVHPDTEADERLRRSLARVRVLRAAGQYAEGVVAANEVVERARVAGAPRVEAEGQLLAGQLYAELGRPDAEPVLQRAVLLAEAAGADEERARAWLSLITLYAEREDFERASEASEQAAAVLERLGRPAHLEAQHQNQLGQLRKAQGDHEGAAACFARALELRLQQFDAAHPLVSRAQTNAGLSLPPDRARPLLEQVLATRAQAFGERHPETAAAAHNLGVVLLELNCEEALVPLRRALAIRLLQSPVDVTRLAREHFALARAHECLEQLELAAAEQVKGVALLMGQGSSERREDLRREVEWLRGLFTRLGRAPAELERLQSVLWAIDADQPLPRVQLMP